MRFKKGVIGDIYVLLKYLFLIAIFAGLALMILAKFQTKAGSGTTAESGINDTVYVIKDDVIGWLGIVAIGVIGFGLMRYFGLGMGDKAAQ